MTLSHSGTEAGAATELVVIVGETTVPALAAACTLDYRTVVLAHSSDTAAAAIRLANILRKQYRKRVRTVDFGSPDDFGECSAASARLPVSAPYALDYTGGTKIMSLTAIWQHLADHHEVSGSEALRTYVDYRADAVCADDGVVIPLRDDGVDLRTLAMLSGHVMRAGSAVAASTDRSALLASARRVATSLTDTHSVQVADVRVLARRLGVALGGREVVGVARELVGAAATVLAAPVGSEIVWAASLHREGRVAAVAEFDVVVRIGYRVYAIEVKSNADDMGRLLAARDVAARRVFGPETRNGAMCPIGGDALAGQIAGLNSALPGGRRFGLFPIEPPDALVDTIARLEDWFGAGPSVEPDASTAGELAELLVPAEGTPIVVGNCLAADSELSACIVGRHTAVEREAARWSAARSIGRCVVSDMSAMSAYTAAGRIEPAVIAVSPGPKSMMSGLVRYGYENEDVDFLHIGRDSRVHRGTPDRGWSTEQDVLQIPWESLLGGVWQPISDGDVLDPALTSLRAALPDSIRLWHNPIHSHPQVCVATAADRCWTIGLLGLNSFRIAGNRWRASSPKRTEMINRSREQLIRSAAEISSIVGSINRVVAVLPDWFRLRIDSPADELACVQAATWDSFRTTERWLPWATWNQRGDEMVLSEIELEL